MDVVKYAIISYRKSNEINNVTGEWKYAPYKYEIAECYVLNIQNTFFHNEPIVKYTCKLIKDNSVVLIEDLVFDTFEDAENKMKQLIIIR